MDKLKNYLDFIKTIEGIKSVTRTAWTETGRHESTAEHSWRLAMLALILKDEFPELDSYKVLTMCLIHDMGELYTGDIPAIANPCTEDKEAREHKDVSKIFSILPDETGANLLALWEEYSEAVTPEARLVKALDKAETILQHNQGKNPPDFDYGFNLSYGKKYFEDDNRLKVLREVLDKETKELFTQNSSPHP